MNRVVSLVLAIVLVLSSALSAHVEAAPPGDSCAKPTPVAAGHHCCCKHPPDEPCPCEVSPTDEAPAPEPAQAPAPERAPTVALEPLPSPLLLDITTDEHPQGLLRRDEERAPDHVRRHVSKGVFLE